MLGFGGPDSPGIVSWEQASFYFGISEGAVDLGHCHHCSLSVFDDSCVLHIVPTSVHWTVATAREPRFWPDVFFSSCHWQCALSLDGPVGTLHFPTFGDMSVPFVSNSTIKGSTCSICNHTMLSLYYILYRPTIDQSLSFHMCHKYMYYVILLILYYILYIYIYDTTIV